MKNGCLPLLGVLGLLAVLSPALRKSEDATDDKMSMNFRASAGECATIGGIVERNFTGPQYRNPAPGVFYMSPLQWAGLQEADRQTIGKAMAFQKGCALDSNPNLIDVEIRSIASNKLLATGPYWQLKDQ